MSYPSWAGIKFQRAIIRSFRGILAAWETWLMETEQEKKKNEVKN